jgi:hypothetical protein
VLILTGANSAVGLRSMPARYLFLDEVDGYPGDVEGEGDPILLAERRSATFQRRKFLLVSTPKTKSLSRIWSRRCVAIEFGMMGLGAGGLASRTGPLSAEMGRACGVHSTALPGMAPAICARSRLSSAGLAFSSSRSHSANTTPGSSRPNGGILGRAFSMARALC